MDIISPLVRILRSHNSWTLKRILMRVTDHVLPQLPLVWMSLYLHLTPWEWVRVTEPFY